MRKFLTILVVVLVAFALASCAVTEKKSVLIINNTSDTDVKAIKVGTKSFGACPSGATRKKVISKEVTGALTATGATSALSSSYDLDGDYTLRSEGGYQFNLSITNNDGQVQMGQISVTYLGVDQVDDTADNDAADADDHLLYDHDGDGTYDAADSCYQW
ncbi:MAG: hypothetical protein MJB14_12765 [Spirochaetes bacterium]|nr:hypothetical protein [Spirochaetota bacterium]